MADDTNRSDDCDESSEGDESTRRPRVPRRLSEPRRRKLLTAVAAGGSLSLTGCLSLYSFGTTPEEWAEERDIDEMDDDEDEAPSGTEDDDGSDDDSDGGSDDEANDGEEDEEGGDETHEVEYLKQGETLELSSDQSLLVAGEEQGWDLPYSCRRGICGSCTARLWGDARDRVEMKGNSFLSDEEIRDGFTLTCVGYPRSDFVLETGERDALDR